MKRASCRSCSAPIIWAQTEGHRNMPLDLEPVADGNVVVKHVEFEGTSLERWIVTVLAGEHPEVHPDRLRYRSHFATCPNAAAHRKR